jgi:tetratricopeptide (TPR) repeat protein
LTSCAPRAAVLAARGTAALALLICAAGLDGCAARRSSVALPGVARPAASLEQYISKVRELSGNARPPARTEPFAQTVEHWDPALASALADLAVTPTAEQHRLVADQYWRLHVLDQAYAHLAAAVRIAPEDAAAHDGLARIWRTWGFPQLGLDDARAAVRAAPESPEAANTMGTLFAAMGHLQQARSWYARALSLDPAAGYALNNICYTAVMLGERDAVEPCSRAATLEPSTMARNNLGLAYAVHGDLVHARASFAAASGEVAADYNMAITHLARGEYRQASDLLSSVLRAQPAFPGAAVRERQARAELIAAAGPGVTHDPDPRR